MPVIPSILEAAPRRRISVPGYGGGLCPTRYVMLSALFAFLLIGSPMYGAVHLVPATPFLEVTGANAVEQSDRVKATGCEEEGSSSCEEATEATVNSGLADTPWPTFGYDVQRTGRSPNTGPETPELKWSFAASDWIISSPVIGEDGVVYVGSNDRHLYAINPDGTERWSFGMHGMVTEPGAIGSDGIIYAGSGQGDFYALRPDGTEQWRFDADGPIAGSPAISGDGTIYITTGAGTVHAISSEGMEEWQFEMSGTFGSGPAIDQNGVVYVVNRWGQLQSLNPDGTERWILELEDGASSTPAVGTDGTIYVGSESGHLHAIHADGALSWSYETGGGIGSSPAIGHGGTIYVGSSDGHLYAITPDGASLWSFQTGDEIASAPVVGGDEMIYVASSDGLVHAVDPFGQESWSIGVGSIYGSSPAIGDAGTIYVGTADHHLYAIGGEPRIIREWFRLAEVEPSQMVLMDMGDSQTYTVTVRDLDGEPISGALIHVEDEVQGANYSTLPTDENGQTSYVVTMASELEAGNYWLTFYAEKEGYNDTREVSRNVRVGGLNTGLAKSPWPMWRQNPQHTGQSPHAGPDVTEEQWRFETQAAIYSSPATSTDGTIYVGSDRLYALNPDGVERWSFDTHSGILSSPAVGSDGSVYVGAYDGRLYAINPDGTMRWAFETGDAIPGSPTVGADGTVYIGSLDGRLYAINPNGTQQWSFDMETGISRSPAMAPDGTLYVAAGKRLFAINPDGTEKWRFDFVRSVSSYLATGAEGQVYVGTDDALLYAVNPDGTERWSVPLGGRATTAPAVGSDGTIYVGSDDQHIYAIDSDGTELWRYNTGWEVESSPIVDSNGRIYAAALDGNLYSFEADGTHHQLFEVSGTFRSSPVLGSNGMLYVASYNRYLYALAPYPSSMTVSAHHEFGDTSDQRNYRLVALPGEVDEDIAGTLSGTAGESWRAFRETGGEGDSIEVYLEEYNGSGLFRFRPGNGFWLLSEEDWSFSGTIEAVQVGHDGITSISLHEGWNIISNPLDRDLAWRDVLERNPELGETIWSWEGTWVESDILRSAKDGVAYYLYNDGGLQELILSYPLESSTANGPRVAPVGSISADVHEAIDMRLEALIDEEVVAGVTLGLAPREVAHRAAPSYFSLASLSIESQNHEAPLSRLLQGSESEGGEGATFNLRLRAEPGTNVQLRLTADDVVESATEIVLVERRTGIQHTLSSSGEASVVTLRVQEEETSLQLLMGTAAYVEDHAAGPQEFALGPVYPNPSSDQVTIVMAIPERSSVRTAVYDVLGRRVAVLVDDEIDQGVHEVRWDGRTATGVPVGSGIYFVRLISGAETRVERLVRIR